MQTSLKDQINAVSKLMRLLDEFYLNLSVSEQETLRAQLNDAASSLAYLNLTKDLESKEDKIKKLIQGKIDELEKQYWTPRLSLEEMVKIASNIDTVKELLKEIETL